MINKILALLLFIIMMFFSFWLWFGGRIDFSENENRYLENEVKFSVKRLFNGTYIKNVENFLTDQFPLRDMFMGIKTVTDKILGKNDVSDVFFAKNGYLLTRYNNPKNNDRIITVLNKFQDELNYVNMNLMLVPTSITINKNLLPNNAPTYDEMETIKYIYDNIKFDSIDIYNTLMINNKVENMFYKLDHHWTTYGAYYAYVEYANKNYIEPYRINMFDIEEVSSDFKGSLYSKSNDYSKKADSIYTFHLVNEMYSVNYVVEKKETDTLYELSYLDKKDKYAMFLDNNHPLIVVTNSNLNTNNELVVIKDSFANSLIPFLAIHYKKIHIIDPRYYKSSISEYVKEKKNIKDALILYNVNMVDTDTGILTIK